MMFTFFLLQLAGFVSFALLLLIGVAIVALVAADVACVGGGVGSSVHMCVCVCVRVLVTAAMVLFANI